MSMTPKMEIWGVMVLTASLVMAQPIIPDWHGTFLQLGRSNLVWSEKQWADELRAMKALGMETIIISAVAHDEYAFYRSSRFPLWQECGTDDPLSTLLKLAEEEGIQVFVGLYSWDWQRGGEFDEFAKRCLAVADEVWQRYGKHKAFVGWYLLSWEIENAPHEENIVVQAYRKVIAHLRSLTPKHPILIAPYFTLAITPQAFGEGWQKLLSVLKPDIVALQDGVGCERNLTPQNIRPYFAALKEACDRHGVRLWSDLEVFDIPSGWQPAPLDRIFAQYVAVRDLVERVVIFEFNHYLSPVQGGKAGELYNQWRQRFFPQTPPISHKDRKRRLQHCTDFLKTLFVPEVGLVKEHPKAKVCWLTNDNWLVAHALTKADPKLARTLQDTLRRFNATVPNRLRALLDRRTVAVPPFHTARFAEVSQIGGWQIRYEVDDGAPIDDWHEYADLLCIAAVNAAKQERMEEARRWVAKAAAMWDGFGICDKVTQHHNRYATYKLALLLMAAKAAKVALPFAAEVERRIWQLQTANGGVTTDYDAQGNPIGTQNAETTAFIMLALQ